MAVRNLGTASPANAERGIYTWQEDHRKTGSNKYEHNMKFSKCLFKEQTIYTKGH
jgi:hypothetical protein